MRWPELLERLGTRPPLVVNAYPATLGEFSFAVTVDSYLSPRTVGRALLLAAREGMTVILLAQPFFAGELLFSLARQERSWPTDVLLATGGYPMPASLERAMVDELAERGCSLEVLHVYGTAEVDAGCMLARREGGALVYRPRADIDVALDAESRIVVGRHDTLDVIHTGDLARPTGDGGYELIASGASASAFAALEGWDRATWRRRTGWFTASSDNRIFQARHGIDPGSDELAFHEFCGRTGMSWLEKPRWPNVQRSADRSVSASVAVAHS